MTDTPTVSEKLRKVLNDLEQITGEVEILNACINASNDDFLTHAVKVE